LVNWISDFLKGPECKKHEITEEWLENPREINIEHVSRRLTLELGLYRLKNNICYKKYALWVKYLCKLEVCNLLFSF
jgi:uncharacterized protein (DUF1015 family)